MADQLDRSASDEPVPCKGCRSTVHLTTESRERILAEYLADNPQPRASAEVVAERLAHCAGCPDLTYGTTCRHCGCLVEVIAHLEGKRCPKPGQARW